MNLNSLERINIIIFDLVRWGNSLSVASRCLNWIRQGEQLSPLMYNVYTDDLNHHLQATGVGCYVE